ncbi:hypothetical protein HYT00_01370 [Candidatus Giovannonibacteria bacterium]|nr:hypothetical protein [Candidatus Giovannonibacteria bacterium]
MRIIIAAFHKNEETNSTENWRCSLNRIAKIFITERNDRTKRIGNIHLRNLKAPQNRIRKTKTNTNAPAYRPYGTKEYEIEISVNSPRTFTEDNNDDVIAITIIPNARKPMTAHVLNTIRNHRGGVEIWSLFS